MIFMVDTNVMLDIIEKRQPFFDDSYLVLRNALENGDRVMYPVSATTDIAYILRKSKGTNIREYLVRLSSVLSIVDVTTEDFNMALKMNMSDFEDALLSAVAKRNKAKYIVTRNKKDYMKSAVEAITPEEFLEKIGLDS